MNQHDTPAKVASTDGLGPLPEADGTAEANKERHPECGYTFDEIPAWSEPLVRAYAAAEVARAVTAERERMIADGWRQTRYVAPVTDCEACLTPDACAIRGQCAHYLRERG